MRIARKLLLALIALVLIGSLALALMPGPVPVDATRAVTGPFVQYVEDEGRTRLRDPYVIQAPVGGYLRRVALEPGDTVRTGDVLFELESNPAPALDPRTRGQAREAVSAAQARLEAAEASLENSRIQHEVAVAEFRRYQDMYRDGLVSAEFIERMRARRDTAAAAERSARHVMDVARFELESARAVLEIADGERDSSNQPVLSVRAPIPATVTQRHRYSEGPVSGGEPVLEIGNLDTLEVRVDLLSMDAVRVRSGMPVVLEHWGGDGALDGRVRRVGPGGFTRVSALGVDEQRVPVLVEITSDRRHWIDLGDGYRVEARFILWEGDDILQVPTSALFRTDDQWAVFVITDERAALRPVTIGRRSGSDTQITDGLRPGELVITHPGDQVRDGTRVEADIRP